MSKGQRLKSILDRAKGKEKQYEWLGAAELYGQALSAVGKKDLLRKGEIQERIGYCFYRGAFQAESQKEFKRHMGLSVEAYSEAAELLERAGDSNKQAQISLCWARAAYGKSWLAADPTDRTALLDECRILSNDAVKAYDKARDHAGQGHACNELVTCLIDRSEFAQDAQELKNIVEEALAYGEKAVHALAESGDEHALTRAYYQLSWGYVNFAEVHESIEKQKNLRQQALSHAEKAVEVAESTGDKYSLGMSVIALEQARWALHVDVESSLKQLEKTLESAIVTRDILLITHMRQRQAARRKFYAQTVEDPDKRREEYTKVIQDFEDAVAKLELLSYPYIVAYYHHPSCYVNLASDETDLQKKQGLLMKAVEIAGKYLPKARRTGSPWSTVLVLHPLSAALDHLAAIETETGEKRRLLAQAAEHREAAVNIAERLWPFSYWDRGMLQSRLGPLKVELAKLETDGQKKKDLLTAATMTMEESMNLIKKSLKTFAESRAAYTHVGLAQDFFGGVLHQLYLMTSEKTYLERAVKSYEDAIEALEKADLPSRMAEAHWHMAKLYDQLDEHLKAAQAFTAASKHYTAAGTRLLQLKTFYTDHAVYMQAWNEIEQAKDQHAKGQYGKAGEYYEKAADLHRSTERWNYLNPNYLAWARLEEAEDLSRKGQPEEARDLFQEAANLFVEAQKSIMERLEKTESEDEKEMLVSLAKASDTRHEYGLGRIALEEAKVLDRLGNHRASSSKYASAAELFQKASEALKDESDRQELRPIVDLCRAWQKMTQAEAGAAPDLYLEASQLFEEAKEHSLDEKAKVLALGHSCFCKALEAGTKFETTRDMTMYSTAKKHLEAASNHYLKAGFKSASEYARATHRLFDAYMYVHKAETETDPRKKAQYYQMAEKLLQTSAGSYMKAKHPEKTEEVGRLIESVKEEQQLAMSLTEVLHTPAIASTTTSFSTPTPTHEQAVGLERFEHADIQANLILRVAEVKVDEDVEFRVELVNTGKAPALLVKVDEIVPEGFEIKQVPEMYTFEDSYVNMKGRRVNPLKTVDVKMVINPRSKGTFTVKPRVLYIDETGKYRSHEPEPVTITVKELGIKGWIKGER